MCSYTYVLLHSILPYFAKSYEIGPKICGNPPILLFSRPYIPSDLPEFVTPRYPPNSLNAARNPYFSKSLVFFIAQGFVKIREKKHALSQRGWDEFNKLHIRLDNERSILGVW